MKEFINSIFPSYPNLYEWMIVIINPIIYVTLGLLLGYVIIRICRKDYFTIEKEKNNENWND